MLENFRSRDKSWDYAAIALEFFRTARIPFTEMKNADELVGNTARDNSRYCFAKAGEVYLVYLPAGGTADLDLEGRDRPVQRELVQPAHRRAASAGRRHDRSPAAPRLRSGTPPDGATEDWLASFARTDAHGPVGL